MASETDPVLDACHNAVGAEPVFGTFHPTPAQQFVISLAHRTRLKRGAFRPMLSRLVNLLRNGPIDITD
jgi:hypothetical protein